MNQFQFFVLLNSYIIRNKTWEIKTSRMFNTHIPLWPSVNPCKAESVKMTLFIAVFILRAYQEKFFGWSFHLIFEGIYHFLCRNIVRDMTIMISTSYFEEGSSPNALAGWINYYYGGGERLYKSHQVSSRGKEVSKSTRKRLT